MMNVFRTLPKTVAVALSGGSDSMFCLHYLLQKGHNIKVAHYQHNSDFAETEKDFVLDVCKKLNLEVVTEIQTENQGGRSKEEYWRNGRYDFFKSLNLPVVVGCTLDDAVEWYLFSALNGKIQLIEYSHANVVRPFLLHRKHEMQSFLVENNIEWLEDPSNQDTEFARRNEIRHSLIPAAVKVNPGLFNMVKRMIVKKHMIGALEFERLK